MIMSGCYLDKNVLENICLEIDANYQLDEIPDRKIVCDDILKWIRLEGEEKVKQITSSGNDSSRYLARYAQQDFDQMMIRYDSFIGSYIALKEEYNAEREKRFEIKYSAEIKKPFEAKRLAKDAIYGGIVGSLFSYNNATLIGAGAGVVLGTYSELTHEKPRLSPVSWGVIAGGLVGSLFNNPEFGQMPSYIGAGIGGFLGFVKAVRVGKEEHRKMLKQAEEGFKTLNTSFDAKVKELYSRYTQPDHRSY